MLIDERRARLGCLLELRAPDQIIVEECRLILCAYHGRRVWLLKEVLLAVGRVLWGLAWDVEFFCHRRFGWFHDRDADGTCWLCQDSEYDGPAREDPRACGHCRKELLLEDDDACPFCGEEEY